MSACPEPRYPAMKPYKIQLEIREIADDILELVLIPPSQAPLRTNLTRSVLATILARTQASYAQGSKAPLQAIGRELFCWLNGDSHRFSSLLNSIPAETSCVHLLIRSPHSLADLPWELLHDGSHFLVDPGPVAVLPIRTPLSNPSGSPPPPANRALGIAFMAAYYSARWLRRVCGHRAC